MIVILELIWFMGYLLTGFFMDMGWYSLFNAHELSWDIYEMAAPQKMYYFFTSIMLILYVGVRWYQTRYIASAIFLNDDSSFVWVNDELCDMDERIAFLQKQISTLARHRDMLCEPSVFIEQSNMVRINSCKVRLLVPPVLVITSAALYGLSKQELTWLLATEMSRLDRGTSSLAHRNKAMHISSVIYALCVGPFKIMGSFFGQGAHVASTGNIFQSSKVLFSAIFLLVILFAVVGHGLLALLSVSLVNLLLISVLCRRGPDRRYANALLADLAPDKAQHKAMIKKIGKLLKSKEDFINGRLQGCEAHLRGYKGMRLFSLRSNFANYKEHCLGLQPRKRLRHALTLAASCYVAFYLFSYPLFDLYKVAMPEKMIKEHRVDFNILDWNPDYQVDFAYQGQPASVLFSFANPHEAKVTVKAAGTTYKGITRFTMQPATDVRPRVARNKFIPLRISSFVFTRFNANEKSGQNKENALEVAVTQALSAKLTGKVFPYGKREGAIAHINYRPLFKFLPLHPSDWLLTMKNSWSAPVQL